MVRFIADAMLGKLARWLRNLGFDVVYSQEDDKKILKRAVEEKRILLTMDTGMPKKEWILVIESRDLIGQIKEVLKKLGLKLKPDRFFCRCNLCNAELKPVKKEAVKNSVPEYVYKNFNEFYMCPVCQRVYWSGSHLNEAMLWIKKNFAEFIEE